MNQRFTASGQLFQRIAGFLTTVLLFVCVPLTIAVQFLTRAEIEQQASSTERTLQRISDILDRAEALSIPRTRYENILRGLAARALPAQRLPTICSRLAGRAKGALEIHLFDAGGRLTRDFGGIPPPRAVAEKALRSILSPQESPFKSLIEGYCGRENGDRLFRNAPGTFVELGNPERKSFGGFWTCYDARGGVTAHLIAFLHLRHIRKDEFLDQAVSMLSKPRRGGLQLGWVNPAQPEVLRPAQQAFPPGLAERLRDHPPGRASFRHLDKLGLLHITREGKVFFGLFPDPGRVSHFQDIRLLVFILAAGGIFLIFRTSGDFFPPVLRFSGKFLALFILGGGFSLAILLISSLVDRQAREAILREEILQEQIGQLAKVDNAYQAWQNRRFEGYKKKAESIGRLPRGDQAKAVAKFCSDLVKSNPDLILSAIAIEAGGRKVFRGTQDTGAGRSDSSLADFFPRLGANTLKRVRAQMGETPASDPAPGEAPKEPNREIRNALSLGFQRFFALGANLESYCGIIGSPKPDFLYLVAFSSHVSENQFLRFFTVNWNKKAGNISRLIVLPKAPHPSLCAFPDLPHHDRRELAPLRDRSLRSGIPGHRLLSLSSQQFLVTANAGRNLNNHVLFIAYPMAVFEEQAWRLNRQLAALAVVILLLITLFGWLSSLVIMHPIRNLGQGLQALKNRVFSHRIPVTTLGTLELIRVEERFNVIMEDLGELHDARGIQETLWPSEGLSAAGWSVVGSCVTAAELGGDFMDWQILEDGRLLMAIGDVAGHGIGASLITASAKAELFIHSRQERSPAAILDRMNEGFLRNTGRLKPMTFWLGLLDPVSLKLTFSSAGNPYPILLHSDGSTEFLGFPAMPVGAQKKRYQEKEWLLQAGDRIALYSDGMIEAARPTGEPFGYDRLAALVNATGAKAPADALTDMLSRIQSWSQRSVPEDDTTLILFSCRKPEESRT